MIYLFHIMIFKEVFYLTKKELEQLQKLIQKLEKQAVFDHFNEYMFWGGHVR